MNRIIRNITQKTCLLMMAGMTLAACSNYEEDSSDYQSMNDKSANTNSIIKDMSGEYSGQWTLNGKNVDAEPVDYFFPLYESGTNSFNFTTFPFTAIARQALSQSLTPLTDITDESLTDITDNPFSDNKITYSLMLGIPLENEDLLLFKTSFIGDLSKSENAKEDLSTRIGAATEIHCVGYSMNMVYFELSPYSNYSFLRYPYVLTFSNGDYCAIVLDVVPSKSTVTLDYSTRTINFVCNIPQIEIYDSDCNKTIIEQKPELILTFTSTKKTKSGNGD